MGDEPDRGTGQDADDQWVGDRSGVLDSSVSNLLRQILLAVGGMFLAFAVAEWINDRWWSGADSTMTFLGRGVVFCVLASISIFFTSARPIRRALAEQAQAIARHEADLRARGDRHRMVGRLQNAFDMAESDHDAFVVVAEALGSVVDGPGELLLADSSRAHLRRVAVSAAAGGPGCGVETPWSCPAVRRSRTLAFDDSRDLDACPRLKDRPDGPCSALCVPVTVLGTPMGVVHTTAAVGAAPDEHDRRGVEALAEQAGSRIGVLRAMAASELQATTDPLTGLLNRRSLETELGRFREQGVEYAVAFLDLDHFKELNDTFGHETGDRALRSFARLVRRSVREVDLVCRYGGEEFVVVFPDADLAEAEPMLHRIVQTLAETVQTGEVPPFTVSAGVADSTLADEATDVIRHADEAMFRAKQAGRDRIVRASVPGDGPERHETIPTSPARAVPGLRTVDPDGPRAAGNDPADRFDGSGTDAVRRPEPVAGD